MSEAYFEKRKQECLTIMGELAPKVRQQANIAAISGIAEGNWEYCYSGRQEAFYETRVAVKRLSETEDHILIRISDRLIDVNKPIKDRYLMIVGQYRSYNDNYKNGHSKLKLVLCVKKLQVCADKPANVNDVNLIYLDGFLCKEPIYRLTPLGKEITDLMLAVNRDYDRSDYIPAIAWNKVAYYMKNLLIGTNVKVIGRIQSREYFKRVSPDSEEGEWKTAYEVSIMTYFVEK